MYQFLTVVPYLTNLVFLGIDLVTIYVFANPERELKNENKIVLIISMESLEEHFI